MARRGEGHHPNFLHAHALGVHQAFEQFGKDVNSGLQGLQRAIEAPLGQLASGAAAVVHHLHHQLAAHLQPAGGAQMAFAVSTTRVNAIRIGYMRP